MTKTKSVTITFPTDVLDRLRSDAQEAHARSLSSYVTQLVRERQDERTFDEILAEFEPTPQSQAWADSVRGVAAQDKAA